MRIRYKRQSRGVPIGSAAQIRGQRQTLDVHYIPSGTDGTSVKSTRGGDQSNQRGPGLLGEITPVKKQHARTRKSKLWYQQHLSTREYTVARCGAEKREGNPISKTNHIWSFIVTSCKASMRHAFKDQKTDRQRSSAKAKWTYRGNSRLPILILTLHTFDSANNQPGQGKLTRHDY
jgi:hypothetical protein